MELCKIPFESLSARCVCWVTTSTTAKGYACGAFASWVVSNHSSSYEVCDNHVGYFSLAWDAKRKR